MTYNEYSNLFLEGSEMPCRIYHMSGGTDYRFKVYYPWEQGQTIPLSVQSYTPRRILTPLNGFDDFRVEMSEDHAFISIPRWDGFIARLCWVPISETGDPVYHFPTGDWIYGMATISDNEIYIVVEDYGDEYDIMRLQKITFTNDGSTTENIYAWEFYDTYEDSEYQMWEAIHTLHIEYGDNDYIYLMLNCILENGTGRQYMFRVIVYNITTQEVFDNWVEPFSYNTNLYDAYYQHTTATIYENKVVFGMCAMWGYYDDPGPPYEDIAQIEFFMVDVTNGVTTILDNIKKPWEWWSIDGGALDYSSGKYYFSAWYQPDLCSSIYSVDLANPIEIVDEGIHLSQELSIETYDQGPDHGYIFDEPKGDDMPGMAPIYSYPYLNYIDDIYLSLIKGYGSGGALTREIDMENNMVWNLQLDKLEGKSLNGGSNRDIPINPPLSFLYGGVGFSWYRMSYLRILDGKCIVLIYSRTNVMPYTYQHEWYLLEPKQ